MESSPLQSNHTRIFKPSQNINVLPAGLCAVGLLILLFFQLGNIPSNVETNFLGWGFLFIGFLGLVLNTLGSKKYQVEITEDLIRVLLNQKTNAEILIPKNTLMDVKVQQSAIGRFLHYGSLSLRYSNDELYLQDIDQPDLIAALLTPPDQQSQA